MALSYAISSLVLGILTLLFFGILQWLHLSTGSLVDWLIGVASFWWLMAIVTIPWNVYFDAREVLAQAQKSRSLGIAVDEEQVNYVRRVARGALLLALALHLGSAVGLYSLAAAGISVVGYVSSGATLLLTGLRPATRAYKYLATRLRAIGREINYPRQDVLELRDRVMLIESQLQGITAQLDSQQPQSLTAKWQRAAQELRQDAVELRANLRQLEAQNSAQHQQLSRDAQQAIAQLTEDSEFLGHVREIIRFVKTA